MAHSKISICNQALAMLGEDSIRSFDERNKRARMADVFYDISKDYLLAKFDWPFARRVAKLNAIDADVQGITVPDGEYGYQLPADCRVPRDLAPRGSTHFWVIRGKVLYCYINPESDIDVTLFYTKQVTNVNEFTDTFVSLLALTLAVKMSPSITQDAGITSALRNQLVTEERDMWEADANIGNDYRPHDEDPNNDKFVYPDGDVPYDDLLWRYR